LNIFSEYVIYCFRTGGFIPLFHLHKYIDSWEREKSIILTSVFATNIISYMERNYIKTWGYYITNPKNYYAPVIQQYIAFRDVPFELLLYLNVLNTVEKKCDNLLKTLLVKEYREIDNFQKRVNNNKLFIANEILTSPKYLVNV